jgi:hypothetical protein
MFDAATTPFCADFDRYTDAAAGWSFYEVDGGGTISLQPSFTGGSAPHSFGAMAPAGTSAAGVQKSTLALSTTPPHGIDITGTFFFKVNPSTGSSRTLLVDVALNATSHVSIAVDDTGLVSCNAFGNQLFSQGGNAGASHTFAVKLYQYLSTGVETVADCALDGTSASGAVSGVLASSASLSIGASSLDLTNTFGVTFDNIVVTSF